VSKNTEGHEDNLGRTTNSWDRSTHISDANQHCHTDCSLPGRRKVVTNPRQTADEWRVDATWDGEQEGICKSWHFRMRDREQANKSNGGDAIWNNNERPPRLMSVGEHGEEDRTAHAHDVDGDSE
jgi:hypothetical protein